MPSVNKKKRKIELKTPNVKKNRKKRKRNKPILTSAKKMKRNGKSNKQNLKEISVSKSKNQLKMLKRKSNKPITQMYIESCLSRKNYQLKKSRNKKR